MDERGTQIQQAVGALIQARRKAIKMSQEALASEIGLSRSSIANIECGRQKVGVPLLYQIADLLQTTPHDLLPSPEPKPPVKSSEIALPKNMPTEDREWIRKVLSPDPKRPQKRA